MKYNDNGEYKDIYIKTFDTLPVGTEVDYDGQTVPDGWSEISESYTLTEQPAHSAGTNNIYINKIGNLVVINLLEYLNSITANTWVNIGKLPNDLIPTTGNFYATGIVSNANDGNFVGFLKAEINNGYIRVKPQTGLGSLCSVQINATYVL